MITCSLCEIEKDVSEYYFDKRAGRLYSRCKACQREATRANTKRRQADPWCRRVDAEARHKRREIRKSEGRLRKYDGVASLKKWRDDHREEANRQARVYSQLKRSPWYIWAWEQVLEHYGRKCLSCGSADIVCDHVVPVALHGDNMPTNLQPLCQVCNLEKRRKGRTLDFRPDKGRWAKCLGDPPKKWSRRKEYRIAN